MPTLACYEASYVDAMARSLLGRTRVVAERFLPEREVFFADGEGTIVIPPTMVPCLRATPAWRERWVRDVLRLARECRARRVGFDVDGTNVVAVWDGTHESVERRATPLVDWAVGRIDMTHGTTTVSVHMPADAAIDEVSIRNYVAKCDLPDLRIALNGEPLRARLADGDVKESLGRLTVGTSPDPALRPAVLVRERGLLFEEHVLDPAAGAYRVIEVQDDSEQTLSHARECVGSIRERLHRSVRTAMRGSTLERRVFGRGALDRECAADLVTFMGPVSGEAPLSRRASRRMRECLADARVVASEEPGRVILGAAPASALLVDEVLGPTHAECVARLLAWEPGFMLVHGVDGDKVDPRLVPGSMDPGALSLAKVWCELVRHVMLRCGYDREFGVGFVVAPDTDAVFEEHQGTPWLLLNPYSDASRRTLHDVRYLDTSLDLYGLATRECAHLRTRVLHRSAHQAAIAQTTATARAYSPDVAAIAGAVLGRSPDGEE